MITNTLNQSPKFLKRLWIYWLEMFPVHIYLPFDIILYLCLSFSAQAISGQNIVFDQYTIVGIISSFFLMLQMRTFDDLKDLDLDKDLFPERATPRGAVLKRDIVFLSITSFIILCSINIIFAWKTIHIFAIMMIYLILTFKWFFAEKLHRRKIFLTMATHQPIPYAINFFLLHTALASGGVYEHFTINHLALLFIFTLPVSAWETSRKIRSADKETQYETFSMVLGVKKATLIPYFCFALMAGLSIYIAVLLNFSAIFYFTILIPITYVVFYYTRFLINPINENNVLKNASTVAGVLFLINNLVFIILGHSINI